MGNTWLAYFLRLALTGALAAGAVFWVVGGSSGTSEGAEQLAALSTDPAAERVPAVVESAERKTIKVPRRNGRTREAYVVEGTVRTQEGEVLDFQHELPAPGAPSFEAGTDAIVVRDADPDSDVWYLTDTSGSLSNLGSAIQAENSTSMVAIGALVVALGLFGWAGRRYPTRR